MLVYLNDYRFWLSILCTLVLFKVMSLVVDSVVMYIKARAIEDYKKNKGE